MTARRSRRFLSAILALATLVVAGVVVAGRQGDGVASDIPLPFGATSVSLAGKIVSMGMRGALPVREVTFLNGEQEEPLAPGTIYLVHIPNDDRVRKAPIDDLLRSSATDQTQVNYFCYRYADASAITEKSNALAPRFQDRFPGKFCASGLARSRDAAHGNSLANFEKQHGIVFRLTDGSTESVTVEPNTLFVIVVNDDAAILRLSAPAPVCGDGRVDEGEECDDGNATDGDACRSDCTLMVPIPFDAAPDCDADCQGAQEATSYDFALRLDQVPAQQSVAVGASGVKLLSLRAIAGTHDVQLQTLMTRFLQGSSNLFTHYRLLADMDGNGVPDTTVMEVSPLSDGSGVSFHDASASKAALKIPARTVRHFSVVADVPSSAVPMTVQMGLRSDAANVVYALRASDMSPLSGVRVDGLCLFGCSVDVVTQPTTIFTIGG